MAALRANPTVTRRPLPPPPPSAFTATEMEAARNLVLLSESSSEGKGGVEEGDDAAMQLLRKGRRSYSSSSSTSMPSVNAPCLGAAAEDDAVDEEMTGPRARRPKYRSLSGIYRVTERVGGAEEDEMKAIRSKRKGKA